MPLPPPKQPEGPDNLLDSSCPKPSILSRLFKPLLGYSATHVITGTGILLLDLWTGPLLSFPILFVLPVTLSAWFCNARLAHALAVLLPLGRFAIAYFIESHDPFSIQIANTLLRIAVLIFLAFLVALASNQRKVIKILRGHLPICMWCKSIRNEKGEWENLESYIHGHSEADFSHGLCPTCKQEHYGFLFQDKAEPQGVDTPKPPDSKV